MGVAVDLHLLLNSFGDKIRKGHTAQILQQRCSIKASHQCAIRGDLHD